MLFIIQEYKGNLLSQGCIQVWTPHHQGMGMILLRLFEDLCMQEITLHRIGYNALGNFATCGSPVFSLLASGKPLF